MISLTVDKDNHNSMIIKFLIVSNDSVERKNKNKGSELSLALALVPFKLTNPLPSHSRILNTKNFFDRRTEKLI